MITPIDETNKINVYCFNGKISHDFHVVLETLALYFKEQYKANMFYFNYDNYDDLDSRTFLINDKKIVLQDTQLLIYYPDTDILKAIDFADMQPALVGLFFSRNNPNDILLFAQFGMTELVHKNYKFKASSCIYAPCFPYNHVNMDDYYVKRKSISNLIDKFTFRGNIVGTNRTSIFLLKNEELFDGGEYVPNYFDDVIKYKVGLSIPGIGELCYRDIEYMAMGIPMMKFEYMTQLNPPLIPNYHYISINRDGIDSEEDKKFGLVGREREGDERHANAYIDKFKEIKDNKEFLEFISKNARQYYETYLHPSVRIKHITNLLEIN
jgi:hypothetical protein